MAVLKRSTAYTRMFLMVQSADHITGLTGASPTVNISKNAGAFAGAAGAVAEVANGWYSVALTTVDTNSLGDLAYHITAASADPTDFADQIQTHLLSDFNIDAFGNMVLTSNIKQNQALNGFPFVMTAVTTILPKTGLTVTAQRSLGGAGFAPCANSVTELSNGIYTINLASTDLNAATIMLRFTATGANDQNILLITQP